MEIKYPTTMCSNAKSPARQSSIYVAYLAVLFGVFVAGCNRGTSKSAPPAPKPRIALITSSQNQELDIGVRSQLDANQMLNQTKYDSFVREPDPAGAVEDQVALVEELIADNTAAMLIVPAGDGVDLVPKLKAAQDNGVTTIVVGRPLDADALKKYDLKLPFVGTDHKQAANKLAQALNELQLQSDKVLILGFGTPAEFTAKHEGFMEGLGAGELQVATAEQLTMEGFKTEVAASRVRAKELVTEHKDVAAILCTDYASTIGAIRGRNDVRKTDSKRKVAVFGFGNERNFQNLVGEGAETVAVVQHSQMAVRSIQLALNALEGAEIEETPLDIPVELIRGENLSTKFPSKKEAEEESKEKNSKENESKEKE